MFLDLVSAVLKRIGPSYLLSKLCGVQSEPLPVNLDENEIGSSSTILAGV